MIEIARFIWSHPICKRDRLKAFIRVARWQLRSRLAAEVVFSWIGGQRLLVRHGMTGATGNIYAGLHEFVDMAFVLHFLRPDDLFFDIGANVGSYTILASGVCKANTWAFEPDPESAAYLDRNIAINAIESRVTVHRIALGATEGNVPFTIGQDTTNKVCDAPGPDVRTVRQESLDFLAGATAPIMIKLDVEGYEPEVIKGAKALLSDSRLRIIETETLTPEMAKMLNSVGFKQMQYEPFSRALRQSDNKGAASNFLLVRDCRFVRDRLASANQVSVFDVSF